MIPISLQSGPLREFMGHRTNYNCGALADIARQVTLVCRVYIVNFVDNVVQPGKLRFEIEFENHFSSMSQYLFSTEYTTYFSDCWKFLCIRSSVRVISVIYHKNVIAMIYFSDHWKILRIRPSEIVILAVHLHYPLNIRKHQYDCWKFFENYAL